MHRILERLNADAVEMFFEMDGRFPNHHPDPTVPENLAALIAKVRDTGADLGIAFDGDADRIGAVDERGTIVYGDQLMIVYAREILARKPGATFIGEVKCSQAMYDDLAARGGNPIMWKTGHSLIKAKMQETARRARGRNERPYVLRRPLLRLRRRAIRRLPADGNRGAIRASALLSIGRSCPKRLPRPRSVSIVPTKSNSMWCAAAPRNSARAIETIDVDGVRVLFAQGWGLVRASNTQPVLVMRFEASTPDLLSQYQREIEGVVQRRKDGRGVGPLNRFDFELPTVYTRA